MSDAGGCVRLCDPRYLNDRSAFDVFVRCEDADLCPCFLGIEVKYHENMRGRASAQHSQYDEVADVMGCFICDHSPLKRAPIQHIWRDHLLAGITRMQGGYADGLFVTMYPAGNGYVSSALLEYRRHLLNEDSFTAWTLEQFVAALRQQSNAMWIDVFYDRYLAFDKVNRKLGAGD